METSRQPVALTAISLFPLARIAASLGILRHGIAKGTFRAMDEVTAAGWAEPVAREVSTQIERRTALTWDDTGRIAAFITPNESVVDSFAASLVDAAAAPLTGPVHRRRQRVPL